VNIRDSKDHTALYYAAATGDVPIVEAVLARGADVNIVSRDGETALYRAAKAQRWEIVKLLLERQANPAAGDEAHKSSLLMALTGKAPPEIVELLLERGAALNVKGEKDFTPLLLAAKNGNWSAVVRFVEHGADVRIADEYGRTALHFAAEISRHGPHDQQERGIAMAALLDRKADVNARDSNGATPLHLMLERITNGLSRGNDWYLQNPGDQKPDLALVSLLVKHGADTTLKTRRPSLTPVDYVRRVSRPEVRRALQSALEGR
jgi:ankyrin repeat protein